MALFKQSALFDGLMIKVSTNKFPKMVVYC